MIHTSTSARFRKLPSSSFIFIVTAILSAFVVSSVSQSSSTSTSFRSATESTGGDFVFGVRVVLRYSAKKVKMMALNSRCFMGVFLLSMMAGVESVVAIKENDFGFVSVREGAHMFYWLYYTKAAVKRPTERPLIIWLQGGPGASSCGHGNFEEIGPFDVNLNERNFTWTKDFNVLFIDNPVGSGYSFVDNLKLLTTNNQQITDDLIRFMKVFLNKHPEFQTVPLHIFSESYGGKMAAEFALQLTEKIHEGSIKCNLKSVVFGDPWISPIDSMLSWAPFLFNNVSTDCLNV